jgi:hypothetical protein
MLESHTVLEAALSWRRVCALQRAARASFAELGPYLDHAEIRVYGETPDKPLAAVRTTELPDFDVHEIEVHNTKGELVDTQVVVEKRP